MLALQKPKIGQNRPTEFLECSIRTSVIETGTDIDISWTRAQPLDQQPIPQTFLPEAHPPDKTVPIPGGADKAHPQDKKISAANLNLSPDNKITAGVESEVGYKVKGAWVRATGPLDGTPQRVSPQCTRKDGGSWRCDEGNLEDCRTEGAAGNQKV